MLLRHLRHWFVCALALPGLAVAACGERVTIATHDGTQMPYSLARPAERLAVRGALVLLAGGDGHLKLDAQGCPKALGGNFLVRSASLFREAGYATALVDVPTDHQGVGGLAGFRNTEAHGADLGLVVADLRRRVKGPLWVIGTSRGTISAANVASRATGDAAPDGVVLSSALIHGTTGGVKPWTQQTVFDLSLAAIKVPVLVIGHVHDQCLRSPPGEMPRLLAQLGSARKQMVSVEGGAGPSGQASLGACEGRSPHGYVGQEAATVDTIVRFMQSN
ncbi:hypothetical protein [Piscinibacter gummiphilus]|uniref:Alpha/beta hydrolase n=1 Tax=Piscinibacter gummiphilus TaxID=946333 RepID=A0ABZ0CMT3_9BURK|nr:hypothetical protein [Piscinibacter gummiphilus]WOB06301.1 hypothetical protein RXV79_15355 [Piscinibacter gummiphilus]